MSRHRTLFIIVVFALGAGLYLLLGFWPARRALAELRAELARKQSVIAQAPDWALEIAELERQTEASRAFVKQWQATAPRSHRSGEIYSALTLAAAAAGVELKSLKPQTTTEMEVLRRELVHLEVLGELPNIHDFLRRIEELPTSIWMDRLELVGPPQDGKSLRCELSLSIFGDRNDISD